MKYCALAGNPNCGKTTLFNVVTGSSAHVGNWPGVTVDKREGVYKKCEEPLSLVDLPGIYSLSPYTAEEVVSRNYLLDERPDCIINIVDATNLERNLYLTTQLMEIDVPIVIALNMMDEVEAMGDRIDVAKLSSRLGLPVVAISALKGTGIEELMACAYEATKTTREACTVLNESALGHLIGDCRIALEGAGVAHTLFHAIKLVELDELEVQAHPLSAKMVEEFKRTFSDDVLGSDFEAIVADSRYKYITAHYSTVITRNASRDLEASRSQRIDAVLTHKIWGIPIFLCILFAIFHLTFGENFLFIGGLFAPNTANGWVSLPGTIAEGVFGTGGIASPGVLLSNTVNWGTGLLSEIVENGLTSAGAPIWLIGLIADGMLGGLFSVLGFLPQILLLFMFFSLLEDSGYMARIAFILDKLFRRFGLSGRAFLPMVMGFGCSVPAMINARTLADEKEKIATIRVIPFFSCGAKLPILTAVAGGIGLAFGLPHTDLITYGMYVIGVVVAILTVLLMHHTTQKGDTPPFIMELPSYRMPQPKSLLVLLWDKAKHFFKKAFTVILLSTVLIWLASHFSFDWSFLTDEHIDESILAGIGKLLQPIFTPLGLGVQLSSYGWVFVVAMLTGLIAKENVVATLGTLSACVGMGAIVGESGASAVAGMVTATGVGVPALLGFIALNMLTVPCVASVATAKAELPDKKTFVGTLFFWVGTSYIVGTMIYTIGSWVWTIAIWALAAAVAVTIIVLLNKGKLRIPKITIRKKARIKGCGCDCSACPHEADCEAKLASVRAERARK